MWNKLLNQFPSLESVCPNPENCLTWEPSAKCIPLSYRRALERGKALYWRNFNHVEERDGGRMLWEGNVWTHKHTLTEGCQLRGEDRAQRVTEDGLLESVMYVFPEQSATMCQEISYAYTCWHFGVWESVCTGMRSYCMERHLCTYTHYHCLLVKGLSYRLMDHGR